MIRAAPIVITAVLLLAACGEDENRASSTQPSKPVAAQANPADAAAKELDTYLSDKSEVDVVWVKPAKDHTEVRLDLEGWLHESDDLAGEICALIEKSGLVTAQDVRVVDRAGAAFPAC